MYRKSEIGRKVAPLTARMRTNIRESDDLIFRKSKPLTFENSKKAVDYNRKVRASNSSTMKKIVDNTGKFSSLIKESAIEREWDNQGRKLRGKKNAIFNHGKGVYSN